MVFGSSTLESLLEKLRVLATYTDRNSHSYIILDTREWFVLYITTRSSMLILKLITLL